MDPITITVCGKHDSGKTTVANFIKMFLEENGYKKVRLSDVPPLPIDQKPDFMLRFDRNRNLRPVNIVVSLEE